MISSALLHIYYHIRKRTFPIFWNSTHNVYTFFHLNESWNNLIYYDTNSYKTTVYVTWFWKYQTNKLILALFFNETQSYHKIIVHCTVLCIIYPTKNKLKGKYLFSLSG